MYEAALEIIKNVRIYFLSLLYFNSTCMSMYCKLENAHRVQCVVFNKINRFHVSSVAEITIVMSHKGKLIFFIRGGFTFYHCNQYVCFYHDIAWKPSWRRLIYILNIFLQVLIVCICTFT